MEKYNSLIKKMQELQYRINLNDKKPKYFGTTHLLYQSEIHFIDIVGDNFEINATELSGKLNITNGAITQVAQKLIKKELLEKYRLGTNKKDVYFKLTDEGSIAYDHHKLFHSKLNEAVIDYLKSLNKDQYDAILGLMLIAERHLPNLQDS